MLTRLLCTLLMLYSYSHLSAQSRLSGYLDKGLQSNIALQQLDFQLDAARYALAEAKANRSVQLDFTPQYTLAAGGRTIDFPVGDLLNPVYSSLNELTASNAFPQVDNVNELLNPHNFYDVKVRATYPLINPNIDINSSIQSMQRDLIREDIAIYKRELFEQITKAYFDVMSARQATTIYQNAKLLIEESLRVNQSLYANDRVNRTVVARNEQDLLSINKDITNAQLLAKNAAAYLNFLINEPLDTPVNLDTLTGLPSMDIIATADVNQREELRKLTTAVQLNEKLVELASTYRKPELNAFVDVGLQDFDFNVDGGSPYVLGGVSLQLNLYDGGKGQERIKKERSLVQARIKELDNTRSLLALDLFNTRNELQQAVETYNTEKSRIKLYEKIYRDALSLYKNGKANYIALLEARNDLTNARLDTSLALFQAWTKHAELIRAGAISFSY
ncbi:MAG: TolC family protein [Bacteroidota bacterium]